MVVSPLTVPAHNDRTLLVSVIQHDAQGRPSPYPLDNCRIELFIKDNAMSTDPVAILGDITDSASGSATIIFNSGAPGRRWRRVDLYRVDTAQRVTIDAGPLIVEPA